MAPKGCWTCKGGSCPDHELPSFDSSFKSQTERSHATELFQHASDAQNQEESVLDTEFVSRGQKKSAIGPWSMTNSRNLDIWSMV
jgi:hypothetical protein